MRTKSDCLSQLQAAGFNYEDACALRRISMTLHRWHELECGDSNAWNSFVITRGDWKKPPANRAPRQPDGSRWPKEFEHDENGRPFLEVHHNSGGVSYTLQPDRERGALKRLQAIMARYPGFGYYVQGDPRGCALYILHPNAMGGDAAFGIDESNWQAWLSANYMRGIAVYK